MNITPQNQVVPNPPGKYIYENGNFRFIDGKWVTIVTEHLITGNTHATTKLSFVEVGKPPIPICRDFADGLEDAHFTERINGFYYMFAEHKIISGEQNDIAWFMSDRLDKDWVYIGSILKPSTNHWESWSVSSPTTKYKGNNILVLIYEGRHRLDINDVSTGYAEIDLIAEQVIYRSPTPMIYNVVPDDIGYKNGKHLLSVHTFDGTKYISVLYKSDRLDSGWVKDGEITADGKTIGDVYFTDTDKVFYYKPKYDGMWQGEIKTTTNGGNMGLNLKATTKSNGVLLEWNHPTGVHNVHFQNNIIGYCDTADYLADGKLLYENKEIATQFSARTENGAWEDYVTVDGAVEPIPPPNNNAEIVKDVKNKLTVIEVYIKHEFDIIRSWMDEIK